MSTKNKYGRMGAICEIVRLSTGQPKLSGVMCMPRLLNSVAQE